MELAVVKRCGLDLPRTVFIQIQVELEARTTLGLEVFDHLAIVATPDEQCQRDDAEAIHGMSSTPIDGKIGRP